MQEVLIGSWNLLRPQIQMWWNKLTDQDLDAINGNYDILVSMLLEKYGYSPQRAEKEIQQRLAEFEKTHRAFAGR